MNNNMEWVNSLAVELATGEEELPYDPDIEESNEGGLLNKQDLILSLEESKRTAEAVGDTLKVLYIEEALEKLNHGK